LKRPKIDSNLYQQKSPTPLTPVDEAWNKMAEQLDSEMPVSNQEPKKRTIAISSSQFVLLMVAAMIFAGGGTFIALKSIENKKEIHSTKYPKLNSLNNKTVQTDSIISDIPGETDIQTSISTNQKENEEEMPPQQHSNNQTSLSTAIAKTNTPHEVASVEKSNQNNATVDNAGLKTNKSDTTISSIDEQHKTAIADTINFQLNNSLPKVVDNDVVNTNNSKNTTNPIEEQHETASVDTINYQLNSTLPKVAENYVLNTSKPNNTRNAIGKQHETASVDTINSQLNNTLPKVVDNDVVNTNKLDSTADAIGKQYKTASVDTINSQLNSILPKVVDNDVVNTNNSNSTTDALEKQYKTASVDTINYQLNSTLPKVAENYVLNTGNPKNITSPIEKQYKTASVDTINHQLNSTLPKVIDNYVLNTGKSNSTADAIGKQYETAFVDTANHQLNSSLPKVVDNYVLNTSKSNSTTDAIGKQHETAFVDTINHQLNTILFKGENVAKMELKTKPVLNDSHRTEGNSLNTNLSTKETEKIENRGSNYSRYSYLKNNHIFIGLSGNSGLLFSKNESKNIYSYGDILSIGIRNTKYKLAVETGIGFQSLEYHVPYSRTLYTYQATGTYDSTATVSSYKYSLRSLVIPFFITKEILQYNTIFLDVKTGINTSIFLSKKRLFNQLPADVQLIDNSYPISKLNFSFALSPQLRWDINEKFSFNVNAGAVFYLNSLYQNKSLKPFGINLSAGIHYFL